jgi:hypothetical protein
LQTFDRFDQVIDPYLHCQLRQSGLRDGLRPTSVWRKQMCDFCLSGEYRLPGAAAANGYHPAPFPSVSQAAHLLSGARANKRQRDRMIRVAVQHPPVAINFARTFVLTRINSL